MDEQNINPAPESDTKKDLQEPQQVLDGQKVPEEALKKVTGGMRAFAS